MKNIHANTLKTKFFFSMSLMANVIVIVLLTCILTVFYNQFLNQQTESSLNQLNYIKNQLNYYVFSMDNYSRMIISNSDVQTNALKYRDNYKTFTAADKKSMQTDIRRFLQSIPYIHSASLYAPDHTFIVSTAVSNYPSSLDSVLPCDSPIFLNRTKYSNITLSTRIQTLSQIRPFYDISSGSLLGYIEISIPEADISSIYRSNSSDTSKFFIVDSSGIVVSTDDSYPLGSKFTPFHTLNSHIPTKFKIDRNAICFTTYLKSLNWYIINKVDLAAFYRPIYVILLITVFISSLFMAVSLIISSRISDTITKPLYHLISHIQKVKQGHWIPVNETPDDTDIGLLFKEFDSMIVAQEQLKDELLDSQKVKNKISFELLQQQVNPHFLYNTLDNICSLATLDEKETLIDIVMNLSTFYRESLSSGSSVITIKDELEITRSYTSIMQVRYYNKFTISIECPEDLYSFPCLKLLLQPIVENSIYHGIKELDKKGTIAIKVHAHDGKILFQIQDNGPGISADIQNKIWNYPETHFGIKSIQQRIQLHYGTEYGLTMQNASEGGLITTIVIPHK